MTAWKKQLLAQMAELFTDGRQRRPDHATDEEELYEQIGSLKMGDGWLRSYRNRLSQAAMHRTQQRASERCPTAPTRWPGEEHWCYEPLGESPENLALMREIDRLCIKLPFFGTRKVRKCLPINRKRAWRLMRLMGLEAVRPRRSTSRPAPGHKVYP